MKFGVLGFGYGTFQHFQRRISEVGYVTVNLGDNAQTIAARSIYQRLGVAGADVVRIDRDALRSYAGERAILIMSGIFRNSSLPVSDAITPIFIGFSASEGVIARNRVWLKTHEPIGARDVATTENLIRHGVEAFTSGCVTLALPRRATTPAKTKLLVIYGSDEGTLPGEALKHVPDALLDTADFIFHRVPVGSIPLSSDQSDWIESYELDLMRRCREEATLVLTPLHHVAAPCMAMGVPVVICRNEFDGRFSFLKDLIPIHTPERFASIDWAPRAVDVSGVRDRLMTAVAEKTRELTPSCGLSKAPNFDERPITRES